jgi:hypothetical protein
MSLCYKTLRELGCRIGMDDYVPETDTEYWSLENIWKHIRWCEQREREGQAKVVVEAFDHYCAGRVSFNFLATAVDKRRSK